MDSKALNKLHAEVLAVEKISGQLSDEITACEEKISRLGEDFSQTWATRCEKITELGTALSQAQSQHGRGWKGDFKTFGYKFSYQTALRYLACAKHPELGETNYSIEDWAKESAELDRAADLEKAERESKRKARAAIRQQEEVREYACEATTRVPEKQTRKEQTLPDENDYEQDDRIATAFESLDRAISGSERYKELRSDWQVLAAAFNCGQLPR